MFATTKGDFPKLPAEWQRKRFDPHSLPPRAPKPATTATPSGSNGQSRTRTQTQRQETFLITITHDNSPPNPEVVARTPGLTPSSTVFDEHGIYCRGGGRHHAGPYMLVREDHSRVLQRQHGVHPATGDTLVGTRDGWEHWRLAKSSSAKIPPNVAATLRKKASVA